MEIVNNPDKSGINTSSSEAKHTTLKVDQPFAGFDNTFSLHITAGAESIKISTLLGNEVYFSKGPQEELSLDVSLWNAGVYRLIVSKGGVSESRLFIKN
ncbi:MAG: T9SS type A sorting domain-containing protein [Flavobacteriaceae bacterium]|nr:T9SS type A sorting domain-containing protein [Flavobacteriaceae bacterium]